MLFEMPFSWRLNRRRRFTSVEQLKDAIIMEWDKLSQRFIGQCIQQRRRQLEYALQQQQGHIEYCFWAFRK